MTSLKEKLATRFMAMACIGVSILAVPKFTQAQEWKMQVGAQSRDKGSQVLAFLPNEFWIHAGDTINFMIATDEPHTVTFLIPKQVRLPFTVGCPGTTPTGITEDGTSCVNSGVLSNGAGYSVTFPTAGNYKLVCLVHANMTAVIHVLESSAELPHNQEFYDAEAKDMQKDMLSSAGHMMDMGDNSASMEVTAGTGGIVATGGGSETLSVMRFMHPNIGIFRGGGHNELVLILPIGRGEPYFADDMQDRVAPETVQGCG
jgi:plastocyanin